MLAKIVGALSKEPRTPRKVHDAFRGPDSRQTQETLLACLKVHKLASNPQKCKETDNSCKTRREPTGKHESCQKLKRMTQLARFGRL